MRSSYGAANLNEGCGAEAAARAGVADLTG